MNKTKIKNTSIINKDKENKGKDNAQVVNLADYQQCYHDFTWSTKQQVINIAYEAIDRHLNTPLEHKIALQIGRASCRERV